ncbi:unnamed protein product [Peronospora belbahrii]|uniref:methionyl-tRNA formyltransferase n=1 Tax=Peronospora belbahrii TaxID=622444 RepID=A0AAU9KY04_9STRA|nr:unnamed protein product [Peronospora belbahrii]
MPLFLTRHHGTTHVVSRSLETLHRRYLSLAVPGQRPYRVLFFGTDDVSLATLKSLYINSQKKNDHDCLVEHIEVVCPSDRPMYGCKKDDSVPVKKFARRCGLKVFETPSHLKSLKTWNFPVINKFDVGVVVSFGYFLYPNMLKNLYYGAINMHPSMLPKYRGPAPIHHALLNGDTMTGVSVIEIDSKAFDVGRIMLQEPYKIKPGIQCQELAQELAAFGADCVIKTLGDLPSRKKKAVLQDDAHASKAPKVTFKDSLISCDDFSATDIFHRWQALSNSVGISVQFREKIVKLIEVRLPSDEELQTVLQTDESRNELAITGTFFFEKKRQALWFELPVCMMLIRPYQDQVKAV